MTLPISARLLCSWSPWWHLLISVTPLCVLMILVPMRERLAPVGADGDRLLFKTAALALLVPGVVGMLLASSFRELRECPFAWNLPELSRRAVRELRIAGALLFGAMAGLGPVLASGTSASPWFFPTLAGIGFSLAMLGNDPPAAALRVRVIVPLLTVLGLLLFAPEAARFMSALPWLWAVGAAMVMIAAIEATDTATARRQRSNAAATRAAIYPSRLGVADSASEMMRRVRAPRDGAARFHGVRRGDFDWARAMLHESVGYMRGGWVGQAVLMAIWSVIVIVLLFCFFGVVDPTADGAAAGGADVGGFAASRHPPRLMLTVMPMALLATIVLIGAPLRFPLAVAHPLSRGRTSRVIWLVTQLQELVSWAAAIAIVLLVAWAVWYFGSIDARPAARDAIGALTTILILMPVGRWMKLQMIDRRDAGRSDRRRRDVEATWALGAIMAVLFVGSMVFVALMIEARGAGPTGRVTVVIVSVAAFFALRGAWFAALRNFYLRRDL